MKNRVALLFTTFCLLLSGGLWPAPAAGQTPRRAAKPAAKPASTPLPKLVPGLPLAAPADLRYFLTVNGGDCSNCLASAHNLKKEPFFAAITFVFKEADARQAPRVLRELLHMQVPRERLVFSDPLFDALSPTGESYFTVAKPAAGQDADAAGAAASSAAPILGPVLYICSLRAMGDPHPKAALALALGRKTLVAQRRVLLPDTFVTSSFARLLCGPTKRWLYDPRYQQVVELSDKPGGESRIYQRAAWSVAAAHTAYYHDTAGVAAMRALLPKLAPIGKHMLEVGAVFPQGDSLYGYLMYRQPVLEIENGERNIKVFGRPLLARLTAAGPTDYRAWAAPADSGTYTTGLSTMAQRRGPHWLVLAQHTAPDDDAGTPPARVPYLAWLREDGPALRWQRLVRQVQYPAYFRQRHLGYNYFDHYFTENLLIFRNANQVVNLATGVTTPLPHFSDEANNFENLEKPKIDFEVVSVVEAPAYGEVLAVVRQGAAMHLVALSPQGHPLWQVALPLGQQPGVNWTVAPSGELYGFNPADNAQHHLTVFTP